MNYYSNITKTTRFYKNVARNDQLEKLKCYHSVVKDRRILHEGKTTEIVFVIESGSMSVLNLILLVF